jgi:hypothetical protein
VVCDRKGPAKAMKNAKTDCTRKKKKKKQKECAEGDKESVVEVSKA